MSPAELAAQTSITAYDHFEGTTDPLANVINVGYDRLGRKTSLQDPDLGSWSYAVDPLGQTWQQTDAKSQVTDFWFDALGRLTQRYAIDQDARYVYDTATKGKGQLAEAYTLTGQGTKDYRRVLVYDSLSRLSKSTLTLDEDYSESYSYGDDGRVVSRRLERNTIGGSGGEGVTIGYGYNSRGYLAQLRSDRAGTTLDWTVQLQDAQNRVLRERLGNGLINRREYYAASGRLNNLYSGTSATDSSILDDTYSYDAIGNTMERIQRVTTGGNLLIEDFEYDNLNRFKSATVMGQAANSATYDVLGNLKTKTGAGTYTYPASGASSLQPHAVSSIAGTVNGVVNPSFDYDDNGNLKTGVGRSYTWTSFNQPLTINANGALSTFAYGPEQQRAKQIIAEASATTTITYAGAIQKEVKNGVTTMRWYLPSDIGFVQTSSADSVVRRRYVVRDGLGSASVETSETGAVLARLSYDAWGRRNADGTTDLGNALRNPADHEGYTGHEHLEPQALIHMNGRVYDPLTGRFTSADPTIPEPLDPQNLNRYSYVLNNPFMFTDPSGYEQKQSYPVSAPRDPFSNTGDPVQVNKDLSEYADDRARKRSTGSAFGAVTVWSSRRADLVDRLKKWWAKLDEEQRKDIQKYFAEGGSRADLETMPWDVLPTGIGSTVVRVGEKVVAKKLAEAAANRLALSSEEVLNLAIKAGAERMAGFTIDGTKQLVGSTFQRDVLRIATEAGPGQGNIRGLLAAMESEALSVGADSIRIVGHEIQNATWFRNAGLAEKLGYQFNKISDTSFELLKVLK